MNLFRSVTRMKLTTQLILVFMALNLFATGVFTAYSYREQKRLVMRSIDGKLLACAQGVRFALDTFHDQLASSGSVTPKDYADVTDRLTSFAGGAGVKYLYTMIEKDGRIVFTLSSYTREEKEKGDTTKLYDPYEDASAGLKEAYADKKIHYDEYTDQWGTFRSIFMPVRTSKGVEYMVGADISAAEVSSVLRNTLLFCFGLGAAIFIIGTCITFLVVRAIASVLRKFASKVNLVAGGDLSVTIDHRGSDELGQLASDLNHMIATLREIVREVQGSAGNVAAASRQLSANAAEMSGSVELSASQVSDVSAAGEEMAATSSEITSSCGMAAETAVQATKVASTGETVVNQTVDVMGRIAGKVKESTLTVENLAARSKEIGEIVGTIKDIADQTNLLALNAAIEAARAGEQGRGFAVVADEVRKLAERTASATEQVAIMINEIQKETTSAVTSMDDGLKEVRQGTEEAARSGGALREIMDQIAILEGQVSRIATAANQQNSAITEISANMMRISEMVRGTTNGARDSAESAERLLTLAEGLRTSVDRFRL